MIIQSNRTFGVEIEFYTKNARQINHLRRLGLDIVADGSLRFHTEDSIPNNSGEYVSEVLRGVEGERVIHDVCRHMKLVNAEASDRRTSVHVHLGVSNPLGVKVVDTLKEAVDAVEKGGASVAITHKLLRTGIVEEMGSTQSFRDAISLLNYKAVRMNYAVEDDVIPLYSVGYIRVPNPKYIKYLVITDGASQKRLVHKAFYFYTLTSDVLEMLVSPSRRGDNAYCQNLKSSFELTKIESTTSMSGMMNLWCKDNVEGLFSSYPNSRYHAVNFTNLFRTDRPNTLEIRSHGGTIDPNKILLWVRLHQYILDKLNNIEIRDMKKMKLDTGQGFLDFIEDDMLKEYIKRLYGFYNKGRLEEFNK